MNRVNRSQVNRPAAAAPDFQKSRAQRAAVELPAIEEIHSRAETMTSLLKGILELRPATHWGINE